MNRVLSYFVVPHFTFLLLSISLFCGFSNFPIIFFHSTNYTRMAQQKVDYKRTHELKSFGSFSFPLRSVPFRSVPFLVERDENLFFVRKYTSVLFTSKKSTNKRMLNDMLSKRKCSSSCRVALVFVIVLL